MVGVETLKGPQSTLWKCGSLGACPFGRGLSIARLRALLNLLNLLNLLYLLKAPQWEREVGGLTRRALAARSVLCSLFSVLCSLFSVLCSPGAQATPTKSIAE